MTIGSTPIRDGGARSGNGWGGIRDGFSCLLRELRERLRDRAELCPITYRRCLLVGDGVAILMRLTMSFHCRRFQLAVLLATTLLGAGCARDPRFYEGPARPLEEVAVLVLDSKSRVRVLEIDDRYAPGSYFELLPGDHQVSVVIRRRRAYANSYINVQTNCDLEFVAEAGRRYAVTGYGDVTKLERLLYDFELSAWVAFAEDLETPIGGFDCHMTEPTIFP